MTTTVLPQSLPADRWLNPLRLLPAALASWLLAAHFLRAGQPGLALTCALLPALLFWRRRWVGQVYPLLLLLGALEWVRVATALAGMRRAFELPWGRLVLILGGVAAFTAAAALPFAGRALRARHAAAAQSSVASAAAFLLTATLLVIVQLKVSRPLLLADRFLPGSGWLEVLLLALYAAVLAEKLLDVRQSGRWRRRAWGLFSIVFFAQLLLGVLIDSRFLMSGSLHLPVPAVIVAGPIYRAELSFMIVLFVSTVLLVGPAWCSHICYIGAWDSAAAHGRRRPQALPAWRHAARTLSLLLVAGSALLLRWLGASVAVAAALGLLFGLIGVALMLVVSRRRGAMVHCVAFCPMGAMASFLGKLSPFRIRLAAGCDGCGACRLACRYGALDWEQIKQRRPGHACTLCGDCMASCRSRQIEYHCAGLRPTTARAVFVVVVVALQAASLGLARL